MGTDDGIVWFLRMSAQDLGAVRLLAIEGRVSKATCEQLAQLLAPRNGNRLRALVVDLSGLDYINGAGLRVFETAAEQLAASNAQLIVCDLKPVVRTAFDLAGPLPNLTIEDATQPALQRLLAQGTTVQR